MGNLENIILNEVGIINFIISKSIYSYQVKFLYLALSLKNILINLVNQLILLSLCTNIVNILFIKIKFNK